MARNTARRVGALAALACAGTFAATAAASTGPSTTTAPYLVPTAPGVEATSIVTVGDSVPGIGGSAYRMVGIPDGLGAFDNLNGTFTVLMNHELTNAVGVTRRHGAIGSFVSKWTIRKRDLKVLKGEDLIRRVSTYDPAAGTWAFPTTGVALSRLCSADLPDKSAFWAPANRKGYDGRLFLNGEESGAEGRAFAHTLGGVTYELPHLGKFSWENSVARPRSGDRTVVVGLDDSGGGQLYVYIGRKRAKGNPVERAGLVGGTLYGVKVVDHPAEDPAAGIPSGTRFELVSLGDVSGTTGAQLELDSVAAGITAFQRPEDGAWTPDDRGEFTFATTASIDGNSRLWRLDFDNPTRPELGGTIDMLLDGTEGQRMMDNLTVDDGGDVVVQEDPGNQPLLARVHRYSAATDTLTTMAQFDPALFTAGAPAFLTQDEESSGVIPVERILGKDMYLLDAQVHLASADPELVEGGQLLAVRIPDATPAP